MKKTLLSVIAGLAVIGSAIAVPSMDVQQKNCEDGQHVWVEKTKTCVPINPCLSGDHTISDAYCREVNGTTESVTNGISVWDVMDFWTEYKNLDCDVAKGKILNDGGKTFVPCIGNDYLVFELSGDDVFLVTDPLCWIGGYRARMPYDGWPTQCENSSQDYCNVLKRRFGDKTEIVYEENGTCRIGKWAEEYYKGEIFGPGHKVITNKTDMFGNKKE